jgi:hypothetical protein
MKRVIISLLAIVTCVQMAHAQYPPLPPMETYKHGWNKIGEVKADFRLESESIAVLGEDKFKSIKLKITDAPINIDKVIVFYENAKEQEIPLSGMMTVGSESKVFDLSYPSEEIKKVSFTYKSEPNYRGEKAHVELYGFKQ